MDITTSGTNSTFSTGDIVSLRSGSIHMTVSARIGERSVSCVYYNAVSGLFTEQTFFASCLRGGTTAPQNPIGVTR